jgi:hypothetical protein
MSKDFFNEVLLEERQLPSDVFFTQVEPTIERGADRAGELTATLTRAPAVTPEPIADPFALTQDPQPVLQDDVDSDLIQEQLDEQRRRRRKQLEARQRAVATDSGRFLENPERVPRPLERGGVPNFMIDEPDVFQEGALDQTKLEKQAIINNIEELQPGFSMARSVKNELLKLPKSVLENQLELSKLRMKGITPELQKDMVGPLDSSMTAQAIMKRDNLEDYEMFEEDGKFYLFPPGSQVPSRFQLITERAETITEPGRF